MAKKSSSTRKYSPAAGKSVEREMKAMKQGKLEERPEWQEGYESKAGDYDWIGQRRVSEGKKVPPPPKK